jgi:acyl carrier protein
MDATFLTLIATTLKVPVTELREDSTTQTLPQWTSLTHWEVIEAMEEYYHIELTMDEATEFENLGALYKILQKKRSH